MPEQLIETGRTGSVREASSDSGGRVIEIDLITPGWGSSGYYSPQVLEAAGHDHVFPAGTHMYIDHPTATEDMDRPERSIRDLAAVLQEDATWNAERQTLRSTALVFGPYQPLVAEMKDAIGVSIRAGGDIELGEAEGRKGRIVTKLIHGTSADFVTRAGRGGKITALLESARTQLAEARNVGQHLESRLHQDFTNRADDMAANGHLTRDERIHLSNAVGQGLSAFAGHLEEHAPQLYQRDIYDEPTATKPDVSENATTTVPADSGAGTPTPKKEGLVPELTEAEVTQLRESAARAEAAERQLAESTARLAALQARDTARPGVAAKVAESTVLTGRSKTQARVVESVLRDLPMTDGNVDDTALAAAVEAAVKEAEAEFADAAPVKESYGAFGSQQGARSTEIAESDAVKAYDAASARTFGRTIQGA
jgi:hypothetical protein